MWFPVTSIFRMKVVIGKSQKCYKLKVCIQQETEDFRRHCHWGVWVHLFSLSLCKWKDLIDYLRTKRERNPSLMGREYSWNWGHEAFVFTWCLCDLDVVCLCVSVCTLSWSWPVQCSPLNSNVFSRLITDGSCFIATWTLAEPPWTCWCNWCLHNPRFFHLCNTNTRVVVGNNLLKQNDRWTTNKKNESIIGSSRILRTKPEISEHHEHINREFCHPVGTTAVWAWYKTRFIVLYVQMEYFTFLYNRAAFWGSHTSTKNCLRLCK